MVLLAEVEGKEVLLGIEDVFGLGIVEMSIDPSKNERGYGHEQKGR